MSDKLIDTFLAEANDLIIDIEKSLLQLQDGNSNKENVSEIFRAMHTLKGASGMFGYELVKNITHHLESIYQEIRDGKRKLDEEIVQVTFKTLDQLRVLFEGSAQMTPPPGYDELLDSIKNLVLADDYASESTHPHSSRNGVTEKTYYVFFKPSQQILKKGTNPLYLADDLLALGHGIALPIVMDLPVLEDLSTDQCYLSFEVILVTDKTVEDIQTVFLFVEGECDFEVKLLSSENALNSMTQSEHPFLTRNTQARLGFDQIAEKFKKKHAQRVTQLSKSTKAKSGNIRVSADRLDELMNLVSELVTTQARLLLFSNQNVSPELSAISENIEKITRRLRDNAFTMSLIPLESIAVRFQRLVSDLSKELNKKIDFQTEGLETMIDKSIIEKITDPILHIIRNCVDHGIEKEEVRVQKGKPATGVVKLKSYYSGSNVIIEIADDGAGLNLDKIREKALSQNLISADVTLSVKDIADLIFLPGFSTATHVTGVSGRGVGMDVVKRNITDIRGEVDVHSNLNQGSSFVIKLPLTLSILDGLLVKVGNTDFILPLNAVAKCFEVETTKLESTYNSWTTLDGIRTPFIYLRNEFGIQDDKPFYSQIINVPYNGSTVGLAVDKIVGEYQAVLKPLGKLYADQDEFSGATILGDGTVSLVLDTHKLIRKLGVKQL
jgi:two-component system chemotaxis sensor kinase CheA